VGCNLVNSKKGIFNSLFRVINGIKFFPFDQQLIFKDMIFDKTRKRSQVVMILVLLVQVSNIIVDTTTNSHHAYLMIFHTGTIYLSVVCLIYLGIFYFLNNRQSLNHKIHNLIILSCWITIMAGSLFFTYGEMIESHSIVNYTLFILALGIIPIIGIVEIIIIILIYLAVNVILGIYVGVPANIFQLMIILAVLSLYSAITQYSYSFDVFVEKQRLKDTNNILEQLSETDPLTGLLNRRGLKNKSYILMNKLDKEIESVSNVGLLLIDVDYFKKYNDKYYHLKGDMCLIQIANCLRDNLNHNDDVVSRYGGEEFLVLTKNIDDQKLISFALRIKEAVANLSISFGYNEDFPFITISIGIAKESLELKGISNDQFMTNIFNTADKELYNAKTSGRNCVSYDNIVYR